MRAIRLVALAAARGDNAIPRDEHLWRPVTRARRRLRLETGPHPRMVGWFSTALALRSRQANVTAGTFMV